MSRSARRRRRFLAFLAALGMAAVIVLPFREALLRSAARAWRVDVPATADSATADVAIVLGGQFATRPPRAARLHLEGRTPRLFLMREAPDPVLHADMPGAERARHVAGYLVRAGVPRTALVFSDAPVSSTWEEAGRFASWLASLPAGERPDTAFLVTDAFHGRRARWSFRRRAGEVDYRVVAVPHRKYHPATWWRSEAGCRDFRTEVAKWLAYRFRH